MAMEQPKNSSGDTVRELHRRGGEIIKDVVYAGHDGIITTFAVVAGVVGAHLEPAIVLILGCANLAADGLSMAFGNYLGTMSEKRYVENERKIEEKEVETVPEIEREEIREIYRKKGFEGELLERVVEKITEDKKRWVDVMMREELELPDPSQLKPLRNGTVTFIAFSLAGAVPLLSYLPFVGSGALSADARFLWASVFAGVALLAFGAGRSIITRGNPFWGALEMFIVGGIAGGAAYGIGAILRGLIPGTL